MLLASTATVQSNSVLSQNTLLMYINQLKTVNSEMDVFSTAYFSKLFSTGVSFLQGVIGFVLAASLLTLLGIISTHIFDLFICRKMVHLGWAIFGLSYVGVIILTFIFFSLGSLGFGFCNYFKSMISNQA
jgi:hypothetical protein